MNINEAAVHAICKWWTNKVDGTAHHDMGENSMNGAMASFFGDLCNKKIEKEKLIKFYNDLKSNVISKLKEDYYKGRRLDLFTDYGPIICLKEAAESAEIPETNFPWKTSSAIQINDKEGTFVIVSDGYRAPGKIIIADKNYFEQCIEHEKYIIKKISNGELDQYYKDKKEKKEDIQKSKNNISKFEQIKNGISENGYYLNPEFEYLFK